MSLIVLSDTERNLFGDWLLQEARTADGLAREVEKNLNPATALLAKKFRMEATTCMMVERQLRGGERMTIRSEPTRE